MKINNKQLKDFLHDAGIVEEKKVTDLLARADKEQKQLGDLLLVEGVIADGELRKIYAHILGIPFVDLTKQTVTAPILQIIPEPIAKKANIVAFEKSGMDLKV